MKDSSSSLNNIPHGHGHHEVHSHNNSHNKLIRGHGEHSKVSIRQLDDFSSVLTISSLEGSHSGNYSCIVSNQANTASHTAPLRVNGIFNTHPPRSSYCSAIYVLIFTCSYLISYIEIEEEFFRNFATFHKYCYLAKLFTHSTTFTLEKLTNNGDFITDEITCVVFLFCNS